MVLSLDPSIRIIKFSGFFADQRKPSWDGLDAHGGNLSGAAEPCGFLVPERRGWDSNPRSRLTPDAGFQDRCAGHADQIDGAACWDLGVSRPRTKCVSDHRVVGCGRGKLSRAIADQPRGGSRPLLPTSKIVTRVLRFDDHFPARRYRPSRQLIRQLTVTSSK